MPERPEVSNPFAPLPAGDLEPAEHPFAPEATDFGTFQPRFFARMIDMFAGYAAGCAAGVLATMLGMVGVALGFAEPNWSAVGAGSGLVDYVAGVGVTVLTHTVAEGVAGTSLGKLALGYRVVMLADGAPCTLKAAFIRSLAYPIDSLFFGIVAHNAMHQSPARQRLGDRWAGTAVVRSSALGYGGRLSRGRVAFGLAAGFAAGAVVAAGPSVGAMF